MKKIISFVVLFFICTQLFSQKLGEWNTLFSYESNIEIISQGDDKVFALTDGKLFSYSSSDNSFETYVKANGDNISKMAYSQKHQCLIITRFDGDIDLLYSKDRSTNISSLKTLVQNIDKTINSIYIDQDLAYLSTNFGLLIINLAKEEIKETIMAKYPFYATSIYDGMLYATTSNGTIRIAPDANLQYLNNWENIALSSKLANPESYPFQDKDIRQLTIFDGKLILLVPNYSAYTFDGNVTNRIVLNGNPPKRMVNSNSQLLISQASDFWSLTDLNSSTKISLAGLNYVLPKTGEANEFWVSTVGEHLSAIKIDRENSSYTFLEDHKDKRPNGPLSNFPFFLSYENNKLLFTGGAAINGALNKPASLSELSQNSWSNYDKTRIDTITGKNTKDFLSAVSFPNDPDRIFVGGWGSGLVEFKGKKAVGVFDATNSVLDDFPGIGVIVNGLVFDKEGNLFMLNTRSSEPIKYLKKGDTTLSKLYYPDLAAEKTSATRCRAMIIDRFNNKWAISTNGTPHIFIFNTGTTLDNTSDDKTKLVKSFFDQDGNKLDIIQFLSIAEDKTGTVWVGTNIGIFTIYNSTQIFTKDFTLNKVKIPRNDGTNNADILLEATTINAIVVDGANRKWIGTSNGVYVVSANGQETYHHFTVENSILPSNGILALTIDHKTGVVYIGTEKGLVSYKAEATAGAESFSNVYVYPNPIRPEYDGPITVTGLKMNSIVKITDVKGNLINQGTSLGGQYIWDGRNVKKERVETGVYIVFGSSEDGKDGVLTKIMVVTQ